MIQYAVCSKCGDMIMYAPWLGKCWHHINNGIMGGGSLADYERQTAAGCFNCAQPEETVV